MPYAEVKRDGGLALTFVNTVSERRQPVRDYAELVDWGRRHGALSSAEARRLKGLAAERPAEAEAVFDVAEELRSLLARVFNTLADGEVPEKEAAESLSGYLVHTVPAPRLVLAKGRFHLDWAAGHEDDLGRPLWRVVQSAAEVLTAADAAGRLVRCAGTDCGVLFVARNPGSPRKWCDDACGHRVKSLRRYYATVKPYKAEIRRKAKAKLRKKPAQGPSA